MKTLYLFYLKKYAQVFVCDFIIFFANIDLFTYTM